MRISRYPDEESVTTNLDPLDDLATWLEYFGAVDYVVSLLVERHGVAPTDARQRARHIVAHARLATAYIEQALGGPRDVSFLSSYYAILNLLKICILCGPYHQSLPSNRWHGATYDVYGKDSQSLLTEKVTLRKGGAIPLFYRTITGKIIQKEHALSLASIYPYIFDVSHEFTVASGEPCRFANLKFSVIEVEGAKHLRADARSVDNRGAFKLNQLQALKGFRKFSGSGSNIAYTTGILAHADVAELRSHVRTEFLYHSLNGGVYCPVSSARLSFSEEFPIILAFFHMSSVVRYKPEFLIRLKDTKYWPVISTMRRHGLLKFIVLFWAFTHQRTLFVN